MKLFIISAIISAIGLVGYSNGAIAQQRATFGQKWAVVTSTGILERGEGAVSAKRNTAGDYTVKFESEVNGCAFVASLGSPAAGAPPTGFAATARASNDSNNQKVNVVTRTENGTKSDRSFHLVVVCEQP
jgi:hypothetical protein